MAMQEPRVTRESSNRVKGSRSFESIAANNLIPHLSRFDFNPRYFAVALLQSSTFVQNKFMDIVEAWVETLDERLRTDTYEDDAELDLCTRAARIHEITRHFRR